MIDLNYTKEQMLMDIEASERALINRLEDPQDPQFVGLDEACLVVSRTTPAELLPILTRAYQRRFEQVPLQQIYRDLTYPLKKGVGNAYKRGNLSDAAKKVTVETTVTRTGAVVAISDEGWGFDVAGVLAQFQQGKNHFAYGGSGFMHLHKARSVISYADNGRTVLIRFLCQADPGLALSDNKKTAYGAAGDARFMHKYLAANLPDLQKNGARLASCSVFTPEKGRGNGLEIGYSVEIKSVETGKVEKRVLTGRVLSEYEAQTEYAATSQLYKLFENGSQTAVHIPKPVVYLPEPPMTIFEFNQQQQGLRWYLKKVHTFGEVARVMRAVAEGLRKIHQSRISLEDRELLSDVVAGYEVMVQKIVAQFADGNVARAGRMAGLWEQFVARSEQVAERSLRAGSVQALTPIHAAFNWRCIVPVGQAFYFLDFDAAHYGHPGLDLGGFLADLQRFYGLRSKGNQEFYGNGRRLFLDTYFENQPLDWRDDVPFFVAAALLLRLERMLKRPQSEWEPKVDVLLDAIEREIACTAPP